MRVWIGQNAGLQHLIWRVTHSRNDVRRCKSRLFHLREVVLRTSRKRQDPDFVQWKLPLRPNLGEVERVVAKRGRLALLHDLNANTPSWRLPALNGVEQIT